MFTAAAGGLANPLQASINIPGQRRTILTIRNIVTVSLIVEVDGGEASTNEELWTCSPVDILPKRVRTPCMETRRLDTSRVSLLGFSNN